MKYKVLRGRFPLLALVLAVLALALLALACEEEEEEATPTPPVAETPTVTETPVAVTPTPTALGPGAAGIPSNPRDVRGLEDVLTLDDGLAIFKERPADEDRTGVTTDTIKLCQSTALSGPVATFYVAGLKFADEMWKRINEAGGIHGRKIEVILRDDGYNPAMAVDAWNTMVAEGCLAAIGTSGSAPLAAVIDFLRAEGVPSILGYTGDPRYCEPTDPLFFCTSMPSVLLEGKAMGEYVLSQKPDAKIAAIYDTVAGFGPVMLEGLRAAVPANQIVAEIAFEVGTPDVTPYVRTAAESGADYLLIFHNAQASAMIKALRETVGSQIPVVAEYATISRSVFKDAAGSENFDGTVGFHIFTDPEGTDPANTKYRALHEELGISVSPGAGYHYELIARALELAGPDLTREGLIEAMEAGFDGSWKCSQCLFPIVFGPQDHWAAEAMQLTKWDHAQQEYLRIGPVVSYETSEGKGTRGNIPGYECSAEMPCPWEEGS